jgi:hypothetical protein
MSPEVSAFGTTLPKPRARRRCYALRRCVACWGTFRPRYAHAEACCGVCSRAHAALVALARQVAPRTRDAWTALVIEAGRCAWLKYRGAR